MMNQSAVLKYRAQVRALKPHAMAHRTDRLSLARGFVKSNRAVTIVSAFRK
jgi:hypothetical protein